MRMSVKNFQLPADLAEALEHCAKKTRISQAKIARVALADWLRIDATSRKDDDQHAILDNLENDPESAETLAL